MLVIATHMGTQPYIILCLVYSFFIFIVLLETREQTQQAVQANIREAGSSLAGRATFRGIQPKRFVTAKSTPLSFLLLLLTRVVPVKLIKIVVTEVIGPVHVRCACPLLRGCPF